MNFLAAHSVLFTVFAGAVFVAAVHALPAPTEKSTPFYTWFYKFANALLPLIKDVTPGPKV